MQSEPVTTYQALRSIIVNGIGLISYFALIVFVLIFIVRVVMYMFIGEPT